MYQQQRQWRKSWSIQMVKMTAEYCAGMMTGAGLAMFFLALSVQSGLLKSDILVNSGIIFAGLALVLGGGGMKMRLQNVPPTADTKD